VVDNATALTTNFSTDALGEIFGERFRTRGLCPRTPDLKPCDYLWGTQKDSLSEKSTLTARQYSNRTCQYFKTRNQSCVQKYFQKVRGSLRSWRSARQNSSMKCGKLRWRRKTDSDFPAEACFVCDKVLAAAHVLNDMMSEILCTNSHRRELPT